MKKSQIYRDYEKAFRDTTGLPINLRATEAFDLPHHHDPNENPFCALMAQSNHSCAACLQLQKKVEVEAQLEPKTLKCFAGLCHQGAKGVLVRIVMMRQIENPFCALMAQSNHSCAACLQLQKKIEVEAQLEPKTLKCFAGLCSSAVPIRVGNNLVAFLQTGQILLHQPNKREFKKMTRELLQWGTEVDLKRMEEAYFQTRVLEKRQYEAVVRLLTIFAQHLSSLSNQLMLSAQQVDSPMVAKAKLFISQHQDEEISLGLVSSSVNTSAFYFHG